MTSRPTLSNVPQPTFSDIVDWEKEQTPDQAIKTFVQMVSYIGKRQTRSQAVKYYVECVRDSPWVQEVYSRNDGNTLALLTVISAERMDGTIYHAGKRIQMIYNRFRTGFRVVSNKGLMPEQIEKIREDLCPGARLVYQK